VEVRLVAYTQFSPGYEGYGADDLAAFAMRSCHSRKAMHEIINPKEKKETARRIRFAKKVGHYSVLEHINFTFSISGISRVCCYDEKTEVLTAEGWKRFKHTTLQDLFCTLNPATHEIEYQTATDYFAGAYEGKMYSLRSTKVNLLVTPNHRMYIYPYDTQVAKKARKQGKDNPALWRIRHAEDLFGKRVAYKKTGRWSASGLKVMLVPGDEIPYWGGMRKVRSLALDANLFVEFLGYYLSEGHLQHAKGTGYNIIITNFNISLLAKIYESIKGMGFNPRYNYVEGRRCRVVFSSYLLYQYLKKLGHAKDKYLPRDLILTLSQAQCRILLDALIAGDGSKYFENGPWRYYTSSKHLADDVQELALKAGYAANINVDDRRGQQHPGPRNLITFTLVSYGVTILTRQNVPLINHGGKRHDKWIGYKGKIYCVGVPNGLLYIRRMGKAVWCGNSHQLVRHRIASYSQMSIRAVDPEYLDVILPATVSARAKEIFRKHRQNARETYRQLVKAGVPREDARFILPMGIETHIVVTMNARELLHFIRLRTDERAQWEIRELANQMLTLARQVAPIIFESIPSNI